jgi:hypothetical protein
VIKWLWLCRGGGGLHPGDALAIWRKRNVAIQDRFPELLSEFHILGEEKGGAEKEEKKIFPHAVAV